MAIHQMTTLMDDLDRYGDVFVNGFLPNSGEANVTREWFKTEFKDKALDKIASTFSPDHDIDVMGIGTGDGTVDELIIGEFRQRFGKIRYTVVEPGDVIDTFKHRVESNQALENVEFEWRNTTFEKVHRDKTQKGTQYAFISLIHSLYYLGDLMETLKSLMECLAAGGILLIIINQDSSQLVKYINSLSWGQVRVRPCHADWIREFAKSNNHHQVTRPLSAKIDVTSCFSESSEEGSKLLDFLTHIAYFRKTASRDTLSEALEGMRSMATEGDGGKLYFESKFEAILLSR